MSLQIQKIVFGYILGFGAVTAVQSLLIVCFCVYVLNVMLTGSFWLVLLITLSGSLTALTLGALLSTAANSEFQIIQFIPIVIIPQVFFSGLFELSPVLAAVGRCMPLYYIADALAEVMLKGGGPAATSRCPCAPHGDSRFVLWRSTFCF
ncbi:MAG: ABC transporter permease [Synergistaceae bacterium]|jgi:ABC-2 type transport system permease protein|nr:ABC transporter permease [Synergistaceae bacterium]